MSKRRFIAVIAFGLTVAIAVITPIAIVGAAPTPVPATTNPVTLTASPVTNLTAGQTITFTVTTGGTAKLVGNISAHLCKHGFTSYSAGTFGYSGSIASRCVYSGNIVSGGLTGGDYEKIYGPYAGSESTSGSLTFKAGTGTVTWGTDDGFGPFTLQADANNQADLVIQVNLVGDPTSVTYFIQPLSFAATTTTSTTTTTTTSTTTTTTTTTVPSGGSSVGSCTGLQLLGKLTPPLPAGPTPADATLKTAKPQTPIYDANLLADPPVATNTGASCTVIGNTLTAVQATAKLSGTASCNPSSTSSSLYPLNGKFKLSYVGGTGSLQAYVRVTGFDPSAADVIDLTGMVIKGDGVGATLSGALFFDPVVKAAKGDPNGIPKGAYYFDVSQIAKSCAAGGNPITNVYVGDGRSLVGSTADGIRLDF